MRGVLLADASITSDAEGTSTMRRSRVARVWTVIAALSSTCFAAGAAVQATSSSGQAAPPSAAAPAPQGLSKICLDVESADSLTKEFAGRLQDAIAASGVFSPTSDTDSCNLQLHVPGNLLRFETAGGVMVSTVVIVTSPSGRYLSTSVTACQASNLEPCAVRAVAAAKLALLMMTNDGT